MLQKVLVLLAILVGTGNACAQEATPFRVSVEQDGITLEQVDGRVSLKPAPFDLVLHLPQSMGVLVHASLDGTTHRLATEGAAMEALPGFAETGMAEGLLNTELELLLSPDAPNYLFYDNDQEHRFNAVSGSPEEGYRCVRTVASLYEVEAGSRVALSTLKAPLYLVLIHRVWGEPEQQRVTLVLDPDTP
ncbi:MAG: hypothetical protein KF905_12025 [Flavobacteriales bacterium]|nr:hypothetical protein [Flavobacteriales bacterium]